MVQAASLVVKPSGDVSGGRLYNDLPVSTIEDGFMVELGELVSEEKRRLLFEIDVPEIGTLGLAQVCEMELRWVETETMESKAVTIPVNVNVVPGEQASGRIPDPEVVTEITFQEVQRAKRRANDAIASGDHDLARRIWHESREDLSSVPRDSMDARSIRDFDEEVAMLDRIQSRSEIDILETRKLAQADFHLKNRKRGRDRRDNP